MKRLLPLLLLPFFCAPSFAQESSTNARRVTVLVSNASPTGTTLYRLAKLTGAPSKAVVAGTSDTDGVIGVVVDAAGTSGTAIVQTAGVVGDSGAGGCAFDGGTTAGDYVSISSTSAGKCHSAGSTYPTSGQVVGRVLSTNVGAGTYPVLLTPGVKAAAAAPGGSSGDIQYNNAGAFGGKSLSTLKSDLSLNNVDNTSDATKNAAAATLTNKTISGASNTLSNVGNSSLTNSSVTVGSTSVSLGGTAATVAGLTLTTPTIASFANATHSHANAAGGGQLSLSAFSSTTGSGAVVGATSPTLTTPNIGAATATTVNGNTFTTGTYTLTGGAGKTLTFNNSLTLAGTDGVTLTGPATSASTSGVLYMLGSGSGAGNSGTSETDLATYTLPASALPTDNKGLRITAFGSFANNANAKTVKIYFGSTVILTPASSSTSTGTWLGTGYVIRTGATSQVAGGRTGQNNGGNETANTNPVSTPAETMSGTIVIKVTGQSGTASNDVLLKGFVIEILN